MNLRGSYEAMVELGSREEEVDVFCFQEVGVGIGEKFYSLDGYEVIGGTGGFIIKERGSVVSMLIREKWKGRLVVLERCQWKIGIRLEVEKGKTVDIWNVYLGQGRHGNLESMEGRGNVVWMGDFNAWSKRWDGEKGRKNREGKLVEDWLDEWGLKVGNVVGDYTRYDERSGTGRVLDLAVYGGGVELKCVVGEGVVGMDHRPLEVEVKVEGWVVEELGWKKGKVDWDKFRAELEVWNGRGLWLKEGGVRREHLEEVVEEVEKGMRERLERCKGRKKWESGRKRWWDSDLEEKRRRVREWDERYKRNRSEENDRERKVERKEYRDMIEDKKARYWMEFLENMKKGEGFGFVKTDRDFMVDVPAIRGEGGELVREDGEKGRAIVRGLGKREELKQEEEVFWEEVEVEEEEVKSAIWKQKDGKAAGVNGLSGRVMKELWKVEWGRKVIMWVVEKSLGLGYVPKQFRDGVGVVMRKPNKEDYSLASSYRVINLLDVWGKCLERVVVGRLEEWEKEGLGEEQWGGRKNRSSMEAVASLLMNWERGGGLGLMLCMDVRGGYENVGVRKMEERLKGLGVEEYLRKWISSFLRERRSRVKIGSRLGDWVWLKGGTVQGSALSPMLFMFMLGGVLEEVREERVEGVSCGACVDDVDFMVVGDSEREIEERVKRMEVGLKRGLEKWEIDVQVMKLEGMWLDKEGGREGKRLKWLGEELKWKEEVRVLGIWWQKDGGWQSHVANRIRIGNMRWGLMRKLIERGGRGVSVDVLMQIYKMVIKKAMMYGMELYWDGQREMKEKIQVWVNRGLRGILEAVRTTPVDVMLGEVGMKRVEYELDDMVERWGIRLVRRSNSELFGEEWRREMEEVGSWKMGWNGRIIRAALKNRLEGEKWDMEVARGGNMGWSVRIGKDKGDMKKDWERNRKRYMEEGLVGVSDASKMGGRVGIGGMLWVYGNRYKSWRKGRGYGLTVMDGEMAGVAEILDEVRRYEGEARVLRIGVDNVGVLKNLRKGKGLCGKWEQKVREWGKELLKKGWRIEWKWVPGHVGIRENEEVDKLAKEGVFVEEGVEDGVLSWGCWKQRGRERMERVWKEYWKRKEKGRAYFGNGRGELGHGGRRRDSIFLFWMRSGHGGMRGTRYGRGEGLCECGKREDRDHVLLKCVRWEEERRVIWDEWDRKGKKGVWMDMKWLLFEKEGIEVVKKFGRETNWIGRRWGERREWSKERKEEWGKSWVEGNRGLTKERKGEKRERDLRLGRERMRRRRERERRCLKESKGEEGSDRRREGTPIASVPPLGAYPGRRRKVLGELKDGGNRRKGKKIPRGNKE